jgi:hypothetical protein
MVLSQSRIDAGDSSLLPPLGIPIQPDRKPL